MHRQRSGCDPWKLKLMYLLSLTAIIIPLVENTNRWKMYLILKLSNWRLSLFSILLSQLCLKETNPFSAFLIWRKERITFKHFEFRLNCIQPFILIVHSKFITLHQLDRKNTLTVLISYCPPGSWAWFIIVSPKNFPEGFPLNKVPIQDIQTVSAFTIISHTFGGIDLSHTRVASRKPIQCILHFE